MAAMCISCVGATTEIARAHGYTLDAQQTAEILWNCTCYPSGCAADVRPQVERFFEGADGTQPFDALLTENMARIESEMVAATEVQP